MKNRSGGFCRKITLILFAAAIVCPSAARAASFDPKGKWQMIRTEHFTVNFPKAEEPTAERVASILEEIYPKVTEKWSWKPWGPTQVIVIDNSDEANGMASVLPYNWMLITIVPPDPDSSLAHYDDWLRMLLIHEYTHVVQLDAYGGVWKPLRLFLQKTVAPNGINPTWMREGMSQYGETYFTTGGRGRGSYSEMVVRTSVLENTFPPIDIADGLAWKAPGNKAAYVYGVLFVQWLIDTYGEDKFMELDHRIRSSLLLSMINHQARNVYGKTFYELWREWQQSLAMRYDAETKSLTDAGITPYEEVVPNRHDEQYFAPALSPDGKRLAYSVGSPHTFNQIRILDLETGKTEILLKKKFAWQFSWSRDGKMLAFAAIGQYKKYYMFNDLWVYNFDEPVKKKRLKRLSKGARARDPEFMPDGKGVLFVKGDPWNETLKLVDVETQKISDLPDFAPNMTTLVQFANPRISPDGRYVAMSVWRPNEGWRIYRCDVDGKNLIPITKAKGLVVQTRPIWTSDGKAVIFSSDESGISNLYQVPAGGGDSSKQTNVLTGVFQPTGLQGTSIIAQRYNSNGYDIARYTIGLEKEKNKRDGSRRLSSPRKRGSREGTGSPACLAGMAGRPIKTFGDDSGGYSGQDEREGTAGTFNFKPEKYVAFGRSLFLPRFVIPNVIYADDALFATVGIGGMDPLRWHRWVAGATYRTDANFFGYYFDYGYNRFTPLYGFGFADYAVNFGNLTFSNAQTGEVTRTVHFFERRKSVYGHIAYPIKGHRFSLGYFYEDHQPYTSLTADEQNALNLGKFAGVRGSYIYGDAEKFAASISQENGRLIRLHTTATDKYLGSGDRNEQIIFAGDWREYVRLVEHHILAIRAAGGMTWGDPIVQGTFGMGGAIGEGALAGGGAFTYFPFRALPVSALSRTRAMLFSGEYRFPIMAVQRGLGTVPFFLKDVSGALLVDYGNAWNAHENGCDSIKTFFDEFMMGVGAELRGDFIFGHGLPVHGRIGYSIMVVNRDRIANLIDPITKANLKYGMLILALGTAF